MSGAATATATIEVVKANCNRSDAVPNGPLDEELLEDCKALLNSRDALGGTAALNWSSDTLITGWQGITVAGNPPRVTQLELDRERLTGSPPAALGDLFGLEWLILHDNQLTGEIPPELGKLSDLTQLWLYRNQLTGGIPAELGDLENIR